MLEALLIERPSDPLSFLAAYLERAENEGMYYVLRIFQKEPLFDIVHRIIVYGPPASGQHTIVS